MTGPPVFPEEELFLRLDFAGDAAELWLGGQCVADQFYYGDFWEVGLGRFGFPQKLTLKIFPLHSSDRVLLDVKPEFTDSGLLPPERNTDHTGKKRGGLMTSFFPSAVLVRDIRPDLVGKIHDGHGLQPHMAGAGYNRMEQPLAAEQDIFSRRERS